MKYYDGTKVCEGDIVAVEREDGWAEAIVLKLIQPDSEEVSHWNLPKGGVVIEGGGLGCFTVESLEADSEIRFVRSDR